MIKRLSPVRSASSFRIRLASEIPFRLTPGLLIRNHSSEIDLGKHGSGTGVHFWRSYRVNCCVCATGWAQTNRVATTVAGNNRLLSRDKRQANPIQDIKTVAVRACRRYAPGSRKVVHLCRQMLQIQVLTLHFDNSLLCLPVHRVDVLRSGVVQQQG